VQLAFLGKSSENHRHLHGLHTPPPPDIVYQADFSCKFEGSQGGPVFHFSQRAGVSENTGNNANNANIANNGNI